MPPAFDPYAEWLGIPPQEQPPDHYRLLGIARYESDQKVIAAAADQRSAYLRGFQSGQRAASAQQLLNSVSTARVCLLNASAKSRYDAQLQAKLQSAASPTSPSPSAASQSPAATPRVSGPTFAAPSAGNAMAPMTPQSTTPAAAPQVAPQITLSPAPAAPEITKRPMAYRTPDAPPPEPRSPGSGIPLIPFLVTSTLVIVSLCALILFVKYRKSQVVRQDDGPPPIELPQENGQSIAGSRVIVPEDVAAQGEDGNIVLEVRKAKVQGASINVDAIEAIDWTSDVESVSWDILVNKPGIFLIDLTYAAAGSAAGGSAKITVNERSVFFRVRDTGGWENFITDPGKGVTIRRGGRYSLLVTPQEMPDKSRLMKLKSIRLRKAATGAR